MSGKARLEPGTQGARVRPVRLPQSLAARLDHVSASSGLTVSHVMRTALEEYIARAEAAAPASQSAVPAKDRAA